MTNVARPAVIYTGKTITDDQIRALRASLGRRTDRAALRTRSVCADALNNIAGARDHAAEIYNACPVRPEALS